MSKEMFSELKLTTTSEKILNLLEAVSDLSKINNESAMLRIGGKSTFLYTAEKVGDVLSLIKYYSFSSQEIFGNLPEDFKDCDFVITDARNFYKQLKIYKRSTEEIKLKILVHEQNGSIVKITTWDGKIRNMVSSGETEFADDIRYEKIEEIRNSDEPLIEFELNQDDYKNLKELASVKSEDPRIFISIKKGSVFIEEQGTYSLKVAEYENLEEDSFAYNKKFFMSLPASDEWKILVYPTFIFMDFDKGSILLTREI